MWLRRSQCRDIEGQLRRIHFPRRGRVEQIPWWDAMEADWAFDQEPQQALTGPRSSLTRGGSVDPALQADAPPYTATRAWMPSRWMIWPTNPRLNAYVKELWLLLQLLLLWRPVEAWELSRLRVPVYRRGGTWACQCAGRDCLCRATCAIRRITEGRNAPLCGIQHGDILLPKDLMPGAVPVSQAAVQNIVAWCPLAVQPPPL